MISNAEPNCSRSLQLLVWNYSNLQINMENSLEQWILGQLEVTNIRSTVCSIRPQVTRAFLLLNYLNLHINIETSSVQWIQYGGRGRTTMTPAVSARSAAAFSRENWATFICLYLTSNILACPVKSNTQWWTRWTLMSRVNTSDMPSVALAQG